MRVTPFAGEELDLMYEIMADPIRRALLTHLQETDVTTLDAAADELAAMDTLQREDLQRLKSALHHTHLPKMADAHVIDYDRDTGTIRTTSATDGAFQVMAESLVGDSA